MTAPGVTKAGALRVASGSMLDGGIDPDRSTNRRDQTVAALRDWQPHLVMVQELYAPGGELVRMHFRALANAVGMEPCALGLPRGSRRLRTGILADTSILEILDDGPAPVRDAPFWAEAIVRVRATGTILNAASVHAAATTATMQHAEAERLATRIAQHDMLAIVGGDWNCYTPDDALTDDELSNLSPHLRPPGCGCCRTDGSPRTTTCTTSWPWPG